MKEEMTKRTIGVEIEFTGITRNKASKVLSKYFNSEAYHYGQYYDIHIVVDKNQTLDAMSEEIFRYLESRKIQNVNFIDTM